VLLFMHGLYVTAALWDDLTGRLTDRFRCIAPTWPLGAQDELAGDADVGAAASARRIAHFVEQLDLDDVTIICNDTGGGLVLTMLGDQTLDLSRIGRLVLTNCDSYEHFPSGSFRPIVNICRANAGLGGVILAGLASKRGQQVFLNAVCKSPSVPTDRLTSSAPSPPAKQAARKLCGPPQPSTPS
jgi:pimeloyl-ACP methyl ester carboxylesterase